MSYFLIQYFLYPEEVKNYLVPKSSLSDEAISALYCVNGSIDNGVNTEEQEIAYNLLSDMVAGSKYRHLTNKPDNVMTCILEKFLLPDNCTVKLPEGTEFIRTGFYL